MANHGRYDMLCFEGIAQALAIFQGKQKIPQYKLSKPAKLETLTIKPDVALYLSMRLISRL
jgi:phenylalanyl-tRNA synthetase beta chain